MYSGCTFLLLQKECKNCLKFDSILINKQDLEVSKFLIRTEHFHQIFLYYMYSFSFQEEKQNTNKARVTSSLSCVLDLVPRHAQIEKKTSPLCSTDVWNVLSAPTTYGKEVTGLSGR